MRTFKPEYRTVDISCPRCDAIMQGIPIPIGATLMVVCPKCETTFEFAEALAALRTHAHAEILAQHRAPRGYQPAASHVDASEFRRRQRERAARRGA